MEVSGKTDWKYHKEDKEWKYQGRQRMEVLGKIKNGSNREDKEWK